MRNLGHILPLCSCTPTLFFPTVTLPSIHERAKGFFHVGGTAKGWVNASMFHKWLEQVYVPKVEEVRLRDPTIPNSDSLLPRPSRS